MGCLGLREGLLSQLLAPRRPRRTGREPTGLRREGAGPLDG